MTQSSRSNLILIALALMIGLTRTSHFGTADILPDASLAAFLLGGLLLQPLYAFAILFAVAFGADVYSAQTAVEAGWCLTPAYVGLIPTYGILWLAGRWLRQTGRLDFAPAASSSTLAILLAFVVSNATWFLFSGMTGGMSPMDYALAVAKYIPPYFASAMLYLAPIWLAWKLIQQRHPQSV